MASISSVAKSVTKAVKTFYGKPMQVTAKALGVASVATVLYDSHINGREKAISLDEYESGDRYYNQYKQFMTLEKESATLCKLKKLWFDMQQDFPFYHMASKTKGYTVGFGKTIIRELPLIALSALALIPKTPTLNKIAGTLIAVNGARSFLGDVVGIGATKQERHY